MPNKLPLPLYLVAPASLTMMRTAPPEVLQLFTAKAEADAFAARFPFTRRLTLTTPKDVAEMVRTAPGHFTSAAIRSRDEMTRYSIGDLAAMCGASLTPNHEDGPSPWHALAASASPGRVLTQTRPTPPAAAPPSPVPSPAPEIDPRACQTDATAWRRSQPNQHR